MRNDTRVALSFALGLAFLTPAAEGQVFKCKGEDGKVTYTDVPCLRSETSALVDTRSNVADHSSIRRQAARLPSSEVPAPQGQAQAASPTPPPPAPAAASGRRTSGY